MDIIADLQGYNAQVDVWGPWVDAAEAREEYALDLLERDPEAAAYDAVVLAVPHREFVALAGDGVRRLGRENAVVFDVKSALLAEAADLRL